MRHRGCSWLNIRKKAFTAKKIQPGVECVRELLSFAGFCLQPWR